MEEINEGNTDSALRNLEGQCLAVAANVQIIVNDLSKTPDDNPIRTLHKAGKTTKTEGTPRAVPYAIKRALSSLPSFVGVDTISFRFEPAVRMLLML